MSDNAPRQINSLEAITRGLPLILMFVSGVSAATIALQRIETLERRFVELGPTRFTATDGTALERSVGAKIEITKGQLEALVHKEVAAITAEIRVLRAETGSELDRVRGYADENRRRLQLLEDEIFGRNADGLINGHRSLE